jgi:hypothetical protein
MRSLSFGRIPLGNVLEAFRDQFRESHINLIVEQLKDLKSSVAKAKAKIGTSTNLKSSEPKPTQPKQKFDAVSGSAGHSIALASTTAIGKKKKEAATGITGSVSESIFRTGRLPGFLRT